MDSDMVPATVTVTVPPSNGVLVSSKEVPVLSKVVIATDYTGVVVSRNLNPISTFTDGSRLTP